MTTVSCEKTPTISGTHREITKMQMYRTNTGSMTKQTITTGITDKSGSGRNKYFRTCLYTTVFRLRLHD
jgi:hypothetical protein